MIFILKVTTNKEERAMDMIHDRAIKKNLQVFSIARPHGLKGYLILEAANRDSIEEAAFNLPYVKGIIGKTVTYEEIKNMIQPEVQDINIEIGDIVEMIADHFKNEKGKVTRIDKKKGEVYPLDILLYPIFKKFGLKLRNRIIWHFGHGLHSSKRFSGRHEIILWFTKSDDYIFNIDPIRVPQKYPQKKYYKGEKKGQLSGHPLGKNPSDVWDIPNVKSNHPEKTEHPCQFPIELVERLVLSMTNEGDLVLDPFIGVGSTAIASIKHKRRVAGAEILNKYLEIAKQRLNKFERGQLKMREIGTPIYNPNDNSISIKFARNQLLLGSYTNN